MTRDRCGERQALVDRIRARNLLEGREPILSSRVLEALGRVPRRVFVPPEQSDAAYDDRPLPIGHGQTISQPTVVAMMTELAEVAADARVLEVGTGCGYQTAMLAELAGHVYSVELVPELARDARSRLAELGYENATTCVGDGWAGWPEHAPFDAILVTAAAPEVPPRLLEQLAPGGRLVLPVDVAPGRYGQDLIVIETDEHGVTRRRSIGPVAFVPLRRAG